MKSKLSGIGETIFTTMSRLSQKENALNLSQGFPSFQPDERLRGLIAKYTLNGNNQYAPMMGIPELREAMVKKTQICYDVNTDIDQEWTIVPGATQAIFSAITAVVDVGDEVLILEPAFDSYDPAVLLNRGVPVHVPLDAQDFSPDWTLIRSYVTNKTKAIVINTPHNPSGYVWTKEDIIQLEHLVNEFGIFVICDEVYDHITYDGRKHNSLLQSNILRQKSFICGSFGKTYHITGWKIGYCVALPHLTKEFRKIHQYVAFTTVGPVQYALADFLEHKTYLELSSFYEKKRDLFINGLSKGPLKFKVSQGSFFQQVSYGHLSKISDRELAIKMTKELKVACIPVSSFYSDGTDHNIIRFCFAKDDQELIEATQRLENIMSLF